MNFADTLKAMEQYVDIASKIMEVFIEQSVFKREEDPTGNNWYFREFNLIGFAAPSDGVELVFDCNSKRGDDQWTVRFVVPIEWLDSYNEETVRETAQRFAADQRARVQAAHADTMERKRQADIATLQRLSAEYPGVIPASSLK